LRFAVKSRGFPFFAATRVHVVSHFARRRVSGHSLSLGELKEVYSYRKLLKNKVGLPPNVTYSRRLESVFPLKRAVILKARSLRLKDPENA
jgi:hypothetical protein